METYKLLVESAQAGHGRTLATAQVIDILSLIQAMDRRVGELTQIIDNIEGLTVVEGEVIDGEVEIPFEQGQAGERPGLDSSEQEEE